MQASFAKYVGCGNDFILFDNRQKDFPFSPTLIRKLCHRGWGIGADGVILLETSAQADIKMRIFNADGSEADMCGNGLRCLIQWAEESLGLSRPRYQIEARKRLLQAWRQGQDICIEMGNPEKLKWNMSVPFQSTSLTIHSLDTGVPHAVLFVSDIEQINLEEIGPFIRHHPFWHPHGTNVSFGQQIAPDTFAVRTYERGVEGETLACGTGATAVALAAAYQFHLPSPLQMQTKSGHHMQIGFTLKDTLFSAVTMTGPAKCVFQGEIDFKIFQ